MKKLFFTLCALCLCGTMWGQDYYQDEVTSLYFTVEDGVALISPSQSTELTYSNANLVNNGDDTYSLPIEVTYGGQTYAVTTIEANAFENSSISGHLIIPEGVDTLNYHSFYGCTGLTEVTVEYSTTDLRQNDQSGTADCFVGCSNITTVTINRNLAHGRNNAQYGYLVWTFSKLPSIETAYIGEHVTSLTNNAFNAGSSGNLAEVYCYATNPPTLATNCFAYKKEGCVLYVHPYSLELYQADESWVDIFGDNIIAMDEQEEQPEGTLMDVTTGLFFEINEETGVVSIIADQESGAYYDANLIAVDGQENTYTLPYYVEDKSGTTGYVTRIDTSAFEDAAISGHLVIPATITNMGQKAFAGCTGISEVTYEYGENALYEENTTNNSDGSFQGCTNITIVNIYRDITLYGNNLYGPFVGLGTVQNINIGPRVTSIPIYMFRNSSRETATTAINCYAAVPPTVNTNAFGVLPSGCVVNVPSGSETAYAGSSWSTEYSTLSYTPLSNAYAVTISEAAALDGSYYATYYNENAVDIYPQGGTLSDGSVYDVTTYAATGVEVDGTTAYLDLAEVGATVPAGVAVLVDGNVAGTYTVIETTAAKSASYSGTNDLYGFLADNDYATVAPNNGDADDYYFYKLTLDSGNDEGSLGFYWGAEEGGTFTGEANKAYLVLTQGALQGLSAVKLKKGEGEDTTGITSVEVENETNTVKGIYTVQGIRVSNMNQPGLYIVDGKKVLVK